MLAECCHVATLLMGFQEASVWPLLEKERWTQLPFLASRPFVVLNHEWNIFSSDHSICRLVVLLDPLKSIRALQWLTLLTSGQPFLSVLNLSTLLTFFYSTPILECTVAWTIRGSSFASQRSLSRLQLWRHHWERKPGLVSRDSRRDLQITPSIWRSLSMQHPHTFVSCLLGASPNAMFPFTLGWYGHGALRLFLHREGKYGHWGRAWWSQGRELWERLPLTPFKD